MPLEPVWAGRVHAELRLAGDLPATPRQADDLLSMLPKSTRWYGRP
ncbi:hypothetical protein ACFQVD_36990 [Streptosporangium amethystogenes subsp. fukuiense]|uniref:Uncharacterized protein n=1 Tax=Streptosporangium amethystogenes subsp. fukuiense TaxID=698418 RepID=A0ABW2TBF8_9ACTN